MGRYPAARSALTAQMWYSAEYWRLASSRTVKTRSGSSSRCAQRWPKPPKRLLASPKQPSTGGAEELPRGPSTVVERRGRSAVLPRPQSVDKCPGEPCLRGSRPGETSLEPFDGRSGAEPPLSPIALPTSRALGRQRGSRSDPALLKSERGGSPLRVSAGSSPPSSPTPAPRPHRQAKARARLTD